MRYSRQCTTLVLVIGIASVVAAAACSSSLEPPERGIRDPNMGAGGSASGGTGGTAGTGTVVDSGVGLVDVVDIPDGSGGGDGVTRDTACASGSGAAEPAPATLQLVIDISGSMKWSPEATSNMDPLPPEGGSRWDITHSALADAVAELGPEISIGINYFPDSGDCVSGNVAVDIAPLEATGSDHRVAIADSMADVEPANGTPTYSAYKVGVAALRAFEAEGERFVLLITDGQPTIGEDEEGTCEGLPGIDVLVESQPIIDESTAAAADGIRTFVIGAPGSQTALEPLSRIATEGKTAKMGCSDQGPNYCHFDMTSQPDFAQALKQALKEIVGQVATCDFKIPDPPMGKTLDPEKINVIMTSSGGDEVTISKDDTSDTCTDGWRFSDDGARIILCTNTCDSFEADEGAKIDVLFGCKTQTVPPH